MLAELTQACEALGDVLTTVEPARLSGLDCAHVVEILARTEKRCAAVRAVAAARAAQCGAHKDRGFVDATGWLGHVAGVAAPDARAALAVGDGLADCPQTRQALLSGEVSLAQAAEITKTEAAVPGSEADLLDLAARTGMAGLRDAARRIRLDAQDPDERHRRQHAARYLRCWRDELGMIRVAGAFTPEVGVRFVNRVEAEADRMFRAASRDHRDPEPRERLTADALVKLVLEGVTGPRSGRAELVVVCDIAAFQRGHAHPGEVCHVIGGGPVPVSVARDLATESFIKAVLHDGVNIASVAHYSRYKKAELRTALGLGAPPLFDGVVCSDEGCDRRYHLEWDHIDPVAHDGPTSYANLAPRCLPHHREKTRRDREAGLLGPRPTVSPNQPDDREPSASVGPPLTD
ncbi:MAG: hypothetical protein QOE15_500 [Acidimicrobiaceae bacterium]|nr:hypothetical protein [Acidimicrobiaceae bacterium]